MKNKQPTLLELALQAQISSVQTAKQILEEAIQLAEDQHYAETHQAEQRRREEVIAAERIYDAAIKPIEKAWQKVFSAALQASFRDTAKATQADRTAIRNEALFEQALPLIGTEIPSDLPGLTELLATMKKQLQDRRVETGKELSAAHDNSAQKDRKKIPAAKKKKEQGIAAAKRKLDKARSAADARLTKAKAKADKKLADAKAAAQLQFDQTSAVRKQAWTVYFDTTRKVEQLLLATLILSGSTSATLSGAEWVAKFPTSMDINDLVTPFRENVASFLAALAAAGVDVVMSATYRPKERAFLMHHAWGIARLGVNPSSVPKMAGVDIEWVHTGSDGKTDLTASQKAAEEMVLAYGIAYQPALVSQHTARLAVDMTLSWNGTIVVKNAQGKKKTISTTPRNGSNSALVAVGQTYGVIKLLADPPHWSANGH
ncbi:hypothetical protein BH10CYA1_BH10CYA1_60790 [soil metagenome]